MSGEPLHHQEALENEQIPDLEHLDVKVGLEHSKSSEVFYREVLEEFKDAFGESGELFEKLVNDFRYEQVRMLMIDIRGLSGAIGAQELHELTVEILQMIVFKKYEMLPSYVERFKNTMQELTKDIEVYLNSAS